MNNGDNIIKNAMILFTVTIIAAVLLGFTYEITIEPIRVQNELQKTAAFKGIFETGTFEELEINLSEDSKIQSVFKVIQDEEIQGYVFQIDTKEGYGGLISLVVGLKVDGSMKGIDVIKHGETPGLGAKIDETEFKNQFMKRMSTELIVVKSTSSSDDEIEAISGATISSRAVVGGINESLSYFDVYLKEAK